MWTKFRSHFGSAEHTKRMVQVSFLRKLINSAAPILSAAAAAKKERKKERQTSRGLEEKRLITPA